MRWLSRRPTPPSSRACSMVTSARSAPSTSATSRWSCTRGRVHGSRSPRRRGCCPGCVPRQLPQLAPRYDGHESARSWVLGVAWRMASERRRSVSRAHRAMAERLADDHYEPALNPEEQAVSNERCAALLNEIDRLPRRMRSAFVLVAVCELPAPKPRPPSTSPSPPCGRGSTARAKASRGRASTRSPTGVGVLPEGEANATAPRGRRPPCQRGRGYCSRTESRPRSGTRPRRSRPDRPRDDVGRRRTRGRPVGDALGRADVQRNPSRRSPTALPNDHAARRVPRRTPRSNYRRLAAGSLRST